MPAVQGNADELTRLHARLGRRRDDEGPPRAANVNVRSRSEAFDDLDRNSLELLTDCKVEAALADTPAGQVVQFERLGYFAHDPREAMLFHRTVGLRDEWANIQKRG